MRSLIEIILTALLSVVITSMYIQRADITNSAKLNKTLKNLDKRSKSNKSNIKYIKRELSL